MVGFEQRQKIIGTFATAVILTLLILTGPAQAFTLSLTGFASSVSQGESISTTAGILINSNEFKNKSIELHLTGPENRVCIFNLNGSGSDCEGITIENQSSTAAFGYGYGYGYGFTNGAINYTITIDTTGFTAGEYFLVLSLDGVNSNSVSLTIDALTPSSSGGGSTTNSGEVFVSPNPVPVIIPEENEEIEISSPEPEAEQPEETNLGFFRGITGGAIAALGSTNGKIGLIVMVLIIMIVVVLLSLLRMIRRDTIPREEFLRANYISRY